MAAGVEPPRRLFCNGWWTIDGQKMSKSLGNVVDPFALASEFGVDPVRYFLLREVPFGSDGDYSRGKLVTRLNVELANDLGNLAQRTLSLVARNCDGRLPERVAPTESDAALLAASGALPGAMGEQIRRQAMHEAIEECWRVIRAANAYIDQQAPWALRRTDQARMAAVLRVLVDLLRDVATVLQPFMPGSMGRLVDQLGVPAEARSLDALGEAIPAGIGLPAPQGIFPRHVEAEA